MPEAHNASPWDSPQGIQTVRVETTGYYIVQQPTAGVTPQTPVLLALHGWGQRAQSFLRRFTSFRDEGIMVVAAQGPHQTYLDFETRKVGFSWLTAYDRNRAIPDITHFLDAVLSTVASDLGAVGPRYVLGFSQGVSVAYRYALRSAKPVYGVIGCGGDLPPDVQHAMATALRFPVLLLHGEADTIVPAEKCAVAESALSDLGWPHEVHRFNGGHEIPAPQAKYIAQWIHRQGTKAS